MSFLAKQSPILPKSLEVNVADIWEEGCCFYLMKSDRYVVNKDKSAVERPCKRKFIGFTLNLMFGKAYSSISKQLLTRHKEKLRNILIESFYYALFLE